MFFLKTAVHLQTTTFDISHYSQFIIISSLALRWDRERTGPNRVDFVAFLFFYQLDSRILHDSQMVELRARPRLVELASALDVLRVGHFQSGHGCHKFSLRCNARGWRRKIQIVRD